MPVELQIIRAKAAAVTIRANRSQPLLFGCLIALWLSGCASIGPKTVPRDRFDYSSAITESWKRQTLLNIVKLRYLDPPVFVDVGQIVAGYSLETGVNLGASLPETTDFGGRTATLGVSGKYTDRPTSTYTPLTGNRFVKGLMTPISPDALFFTIQSGWPANAMLLAGVASVNGLKNAESTAGTVAVPDAGFLKAINLMGTIQNSGALGMRVVQETNHTQSTLIFFPSKDISQETLDQIGELRRLLRLAPDTSEFKLVFGATPSDDKEIAVLTRSMLHIMATMASQVEVPADHVTEGRTNPGWQSTGDNSDRARLLRIHNSKDRPTDAFVAVEYRRHWFWIDDRDLKSKRAFAFMMMLFTLAETGERDKLPLITIPAQ
jgi:hypothetical protein